MIFHQGESDNNQGDWPMRVKTVVDRLRSDLNVPNAPFVAGELWYQGCCAAHNTLVNQLPSVITKAAVPRLMVSLVYPRATTPSGPITSICRPNARSVDVTPRQCFRCFSPNSFLSGPPSVARSIIGGRR